MRPVLVTAGATRNPIDVMRFISAHSSGRTGAQIAGALSECGAEVHLLGSPEALLRASGVETAEYTSTRDLMTKMETWVRQNPEGVVVHACAVGDYEFADAGTQKLPSKQNSLTITLTPTPKIADSVRGWGLIGPFVTFKAASPETTDKALVEIAMAQRQRVGCDRVFANVIGRLNSRVAIVGDGVEWYEARQEAIEALVTWLADGSV